MTTEQESSPSNVQVSSKIGRCTFRGHQASVLCLDVSSTTPLSSCPLLLSGSEDRTARLWDIREHNNKRRACLCIQTPGNVLSAVFAPPPPPPSTTTLNQQQQSETESTSTTSSSSLSSPFAKDYTVYLGVESIVLEYDLRKAMSPVIIPSSRDYSRRNLGTILQNQDEVNQICLTYGNTMKSATTVATSSGGKRQQKKGNKKGGGGSRKQQQQPSTISNQSSSSLSSPSLLYLAACDDAGTVRFMTLNDETNSASSTILRHDPNGVAVVPTCAFRPTVHDSSTAKNKKKSGRQSTQDLVSGGTDCKIHLWDLSKPKKPISSVVIDNTIAMDGSGSNSKPQVCNPPMVHCISWSPNGESFAAGLGDGSIGVFMIENRRLVQTGLLGVSDDGGGHDSSVVSVSYPSFSNATADRILCSAGTDGSLLFWDLGSLLYTGWDDDDDDNIRGIDDVTELFGRTLLIGEDGGKQKSNNRVQQPKILFGLDHSRKMNWIANDNNNIFVADTSSDITMYTIPLQ